ncbi:MAG: hypothetical protein ACT4NY_25255 [Pseudonocardiales bacterium]
MRTPEDTPDTSPDGWGPACDEAEFAEIAEEIVADYAPRLFGLIAEVGERADGHLIAWGMAFEDYVDVTMVDQRKLYRFASVELAHQALSRLGKIRLVWYNPDAATPSDEAA